MLVILQLVPPILTVAVKLIFFPLIVRVFPPSLLPVAGVELVSDKFDFPPPEEAGLHPAKKAQIKKVNAIL